MRKENEEVEMTLEEKREKMLAKVKKLMSLAENNPSQEEAISAALHAQRLMAKYSIAEKDIMSEEVTEDTIEKVKETIDSWKKWRIQLAVIIARNFRCSLYVNTPAAGNKRIVFVGYSNDVKIANQVYTTLYTIGDKLGNKEIARVKKDGGVQNGVYASFQQGFLAGISEELEAQCTALMIVVPKEVTDKKDDICKYSKKQVSSDFRRNSFNPDSYYKGVEEGKSVAKRNKLAGE